MWCETVQCDNKIREWRWSVHTQHTLSVIPGWLVNHMLFVRQNASIISFGPVVLTCSARTGRRRRRGRFLSQQRPPVAPKGMVASLAQAAVTLLWLAAATGMPDLSRRDLLMRQEASRRTGGGLALTPAERRLDGELRRMKEREMAAEPFPPAVHFFKARRLIRDSPVFKLLQAMPKGGALHVHSSSLVSAEWLVKNATYRPHCYVCYTWDNSARFVFSRRRPYPRWDCFYWQLVGDLRAKAGDAAAFDGRPGRRVPGPGRRLEQVRESLRRRRRAGQPRPRPEGLLPAGPARPPPRQRHVSGAAQRPVQDVRAGRNRPRQDLDAEDFPGRHREVCGRASGLPGRSPHRSRAQGVGRVRGEGGHQGGGRAAAGLPRRGGGIRPGGKGGRRTAALVLPGRPVAPGPDGRRPAVLLPRGRNGHGGDGGGSEPPGRPAVQQQPHRARLRPGAPPAGQGDVPGEAGGGGGAEAGLRPAQPPRGGADGGGPPAGDRLGRPVHVRHGGPVLRLLPGLRGHRRAEGRRGHAEGAGAQLHQVQLAAGDAQGRGAGRLAAEVGRFRFGSLSRPGGTF
ncbi:translation initiation factor IF-2 isoform X8 [Syngnathoides biaculeatus]|uniref:translation initiation factor IF-2 isoform X8 n=1 Tax=Syngnathoides biaculeatus TaxID=300417 RepID=UPI002ADDC8C9|nr:translation initiation factor IF-2 isoform X8 [Syngnathoides biaculeatus]